MLFSKDLIRGLRPPESHYCETVYKDSTRTEISRRIVYHQYGSLTTNAAVNFKVKFSQEGLGTLSDLPFSTSAMRHKLNLLNY